MNLVQIKKNIFFCILTFIYLLNSEAFGFSKLSVIQKTVRQNLIYPESQNLLDLLYRKFPLFDEYIFGQKKERESKKDEPFSHAVERLERFIEGYVIEDGNSILDPLKIKSLQDAYYDYNIYWNQFGVYLKYVLLKKNEISKSNLISSATEKVTYIWGGLNLKIWNQDQANYAWYVTDYSQSEACLGYNRLLNAVFFVTDQYRKPYIKMLEDLKTVTQTDQEVMNTFIREYNSFYQKYSQLKNSWSVDADVTMAGTESVTVE